MCRIHVIQNREFFDSSHVKKPLHVAFYLNSREVEHGKSRYSSDGFRSKGSFQSGGNNMKIPQPFELTVEQRQTLGRVYLMILGWREQRKHQQIKQVDQNSENSARENQVVLAETAIPVQ